MDVLDCLLACDVVTSGFVVWLCTCFSFLSRLLFSESLVISATMCAGITARVLPPFQH